MRQVVAALAIAALACGGEQAGQQQQQAPATPAAAPQAAGEAQPAATGTVHEVRMELRNGNYIYDPANLTIKVGDTVRWINISGFPHNVSFYENQIPPGAAEFLKRAMPNQMSPLNGPLFTDSLATYEINFAGAPTGTYGYYCIPHEALGMKGTLTVQP
jgi:plastocyanin